MDLGGRTLSRSKPIGKKKELVIAVRESNPATMNTAPNVFWTVEGNLKTTTIDDGGVMQQLNIVENGVNYSAKRFNDLKVSNIRATQDLKAKLDELEVQKKACEDLDAMKNAQTNEGLRIKQLNISPALYIPHTQTHPHSPNHTHHPYLTVESVELTYAVQQQPE